MENGAPRTFKFPPGRLHAPPTFVDCFVRDGTWRNQVQFFIWKARHWVRRLLGKAA